MMRGNDQFTLQLRQLRSALEQCGEHSLVRGLDAGMEMPSEGRGLRGKVESALVQLGEEQLRTRLVNPRTATWVAAFKRWRQEGS